VWWGLLQFHMVRGEFDAARELGHELIELAQGTDDDEILLLANNGLGTVLADLGELTSARERLELSVEPASVDRRRSRAALYGVDLAVDSAAHAAHVLWLLGYPEQALHKSRVAIALARELAHPFSSAHALDLSAMLHQFRREGPIVQQQAGAAMALASEYGYAQESARATALRGWALVAQGCPAEGLSLIQHGLNAASATGAEEWRPYCLALAAEACVHSVDDGLRLLDEALAAVERTSERFWEAELHRLVGELLVAGGGRGARSRAESRFRHALDTAARQQARSLQLRAAVSLGRLWGRQGRIDDARQVVRTTYDLFTEGFETSDLQAASRLLTELG
jgi:predicted ATPase